MSAAAAIFSFWRKNMKKIFKFLAVLLSSAFLLALAACGETPAQPENPGAEQPPQKEQSVLTQFKLTKEDFKNKAVVFYGDSITYGAGISLANGEKTYGTLLAEALDFDAINYAVSGQALALARPDRGLTAGVMDITLHAETNAQAHYAIIAHGTNDFAATTVELGSKEDKPEKLEEVETFYGAVRYAVNTLRAHNPNIKILFLTPIYRADRGSLYNGNMDKLTDFSAAISALAEELEYRVIDMYNVFDSTNFKKGGEYTADGLHPNAAGHQKMADFLLAYDK